MQEKLDSNKKKEENIPFLDLDDLLIVTSVSTLRQAHAYQIHKNINEISDQIFIHQPTFQRRLFKLVDKGFIRAERYAGKSRQITYIYELSTSGRACLKHSLNKYSQLFNDINMVINPDNVSE